MKRVLITGGANGLGFSLGEYYLSQGDHVTVLDLETKQTNGQVSYIPFNLSQFNEGSLNSLVESFDIVICNAGISVSGNFVDIPQEKEEEVFSVNTLGHMKLIKYLLKKNLIKNDGRVVFICSASVFFPFPIALSYSASKSALDGFAYALESYLIEKNISVTRVYPGPMNTDHSKYYPGAATEGGRLPKESVPAIVRAIQKRKRRVCPDPISKFYSIASVFFPRKLSQKAYKFYKNRIFS